MAIQPGVGYTFNASSLGDNLTVLHPWAPIPLYATPVDEPCTPFKVKNVKEETSGESTIVTFDICPGTVNNLMPQVYNTITEEFEYLDDLTAGYKLVLEFDSTSSSIVYLRSGPDPTTNDFPATAPAGGADDPYPRIYSTGTALDTDTDALAYLAIAKVNALGDGVYSVDQYVTGSLWADRIKLAGMTARYYYARI
jgi:hypothetical protein